MVKRKFRFCRKAQLRVGAVLSDITANAALQAADAQASGGISAGTEAGEFLKEVLAAGPIPQKEVKDAAEGHGLAWRTVQRAKARLGVRATKDGMDGGWSWSLPKDANDAEQRHPSRMATFGQDGALRADNLEIPVSDGTLMSRRGHEPRREDVRSGAAVALPVTARNYWSESHDRPQSIAPATATNAGLCVS